MSPLSSLTCAPGLVSKTAAATTSTLWVLGVERALEDGAVRRLRSLYTEQMSLWALPSLKDDSLLVQVLEECPESKGSESIQTQTFFGWLSRKANFLLGQDRVVWWKINSSFKSGFSQPLSQPSLLNITQRERKVGQRSK